MTNGPGAVLAEVVDNPLPKARVRTEVQQDPLYYPVRNHIIDFWSAARKTIVHENRGSYDPRNIAVVRPGAAPADATVTHLRHGRARPGHPRLRLRQGERRGCPGT